MASSSNTRFRRPVVTWPTIMRDAFERGAPQLIGRSKAGLRRLPAWSVIRQPRRMKQRADRRRKQA